MQLKLSAGGSAVRLIARIRETVTGAAAGAIQPLISFTVIIVNDSQIGVDDDEG